MGAINVYCRSPISHQFPLIDTNGDETIHVIEGMNKIGLAVVERDTPKLNVMEESIFNTIKEKYKDHVRLFGGKNHQGIRFDPMIYIAKNDYDGKKIMHDSKPAITDKEIATKTKGIEKLK